MKWIEERAKFQKTFDELSQTKLQNIITELNQAVANYIAQGGLSQDPNNNPEYKKIVEFTKKAENIKNRYAELNDMIIKFVTQNAKDNNLSDILTQNGELQKQINRLEKIQNEMKVDVDSAIARDELLRTRKTDITRHSLFVLDRPVRPNLIPYLWVLSVFFVGIGLVIFRMTAPTFGSLGGDVTVSFLATLMGFFSNRIVLSSLLLSAIIVILFLSLKIANVIH